MLGGDIEQLVLSGALFNGEERSSSPPRSPSPDHESWPASGIEEQNNGGYDSDTERYKMMEKHLGADRELAPSGMPPGRTGVKGVLRDHKEAQDMERERRRQEIRDMNRQMEKMSTGVKTALDEERERGLEKLLLEGLDPSTLMGLSSADSALFGEFNVKVKGKYGHLREVGIKNFVDAIEKETRGVWVVVHLYDPSLERCYQLDSLLVRLAKAHPETKFLRTRASSLGFATKPKTSSSGIRTGMVSRRKPLADDDDDDDPYDDPPSQNGKSNYIGANGNGHVDDDDEENDHRDDEVDVDYDVLPTMLVYRDGDLVHNWVRVDWEAGKKGVEELLLNNHIIRSSGGIAGGNCGLPSDDEDILEFDDDVEL